MILEYMQLLNCGKLKSIEIPESVTSINDNAFSGCNSLKEIKFSKNVDENLLLSIYKKYGNLIDKKLMFGDDLDRSEVIKKQAYFSLSENYDENFMNEIHHKIICSIEIDELENIVRIPQSVSKD